MSRFIASHTLVPTSDMTHAQREAWEAVLDRYCTGDDPVHICGGAGCVRDEESIEGGECRVYCLSPGGPMAISVTDDEFRRLPG